MRFIHRTASALTAAVVGALILAGCQSNTAIDPSAAGPTLPAATHSSSSAPTSTSPAAPSTNAHGNLDKKLGQIAGVYNDQDRSDVWLKFSVDAITVDQHCTGDYPEPSKNGHFIGIKLRASTSSTMPTDSYTSFSASDFSVIGPDGITHTDVDDVEAFSCLADSDAFTSDMLRPGQSYVGTIVIDSPVTSGSLVFAPASLGLYGGGGWEWQF